MAISSVPSFSLAERERRWDLLRTFMADQKLDAIIIYGEHEDAGAAPYSLDNWITNDRPGATIVFPRHEEPIELVPFQNFFADHMEGMENGDAIWIAAKNMRAGRDSAALGQVLAELGLTKAVIGVLGLDASPPWHPQGLVPASLWDAIRSQFPRATFKSVGQDFIPLLLRLSDEEQAVVRYAAEIGEKMAKAMVQAIKVGEPESTVYAAGMATAMSNGTVVPYLHMNTGPNAVLWGMPRWAYRGQPPRILQNGDLLTSELFCNYGMRQMQSQLTVIIGPVPEEVAKAAKVVRECYEAGVRTIRPQVRFGDVAAAMTEPVKRAGGWSKGPQIHSLNPIAALCEFSPPSHMITKDYPKVEGMQTMFADMLLEPGMTFALEPSCGFGRKAVTIGGTVIVGEDGAVELNPFTSNIHNVDD